MVGFFRYAFSNIAVYCYKEAPHGALAEFDKDVLKARRQSVA